MTPELDEPSGSEPLTVAPVPAERVGLAGQVRRLYGYEPVRFVVVGAVNSLFAYLVFAGLHIALGSTVHYTVVLVIATVIGILEAYVLQRWLTFRATGHWWKDLARFSTVYAVAFVVNLGALPLLVEVVRVPVLVAQAVIMVATAVGTYVAHRAFSFRRT